MVERRGAAAIWIESSPARVRFVADGRSIEGRENATAVASGGAVTVGLVVDARDAAPGVLTEDAFTVRGRLQDPERAAGDGPPGSDSATSSGSGSGGESDSGSDSNRDPDPESTPDPDPDGTGPGEAADDSTAATPTDGTPVDADRQSSRGRPDADDLSTPSGLIALLAVLLSAVALGRRAIGN